MESIFALASTGETPGDRSICSVLDFRMCYLISLSIGFHHSERLNTNMLKQHGCIHIHNTAFIQ